MRVFCKAMHKEADLLPKSGDPLTLVCGACYMCRADPQATPAAQLRDRDVAFDGKHGFITRGVWASEGTFSLQNIPRRTASQQLIRDAEAEAEAEGQGFAQVWATDKGLRTEHVPGDKIWADTQNELSGKMVRCAPREVGKGLDWNSVMRGFRCVQPNKTRLPFWAPYQNWADLVCPHCSSSVSQGLTSGHHEMDGASPITLAMLRKEVPADDLRFAEPRPTRSMVVGVDREALGHVEALLGHFTTQDFVSGNPDKRRALANALAWLNDNK